MNGTGHLNEFDTFSKQRKKKKWINNTVHTGVFYSFNGDMVSNPDFFHPIEFFVITQELAMLVLKAYILVYLKKSAKMLPPVRIKLGTSCVLV